MQCLKVVNQMQIFLNLKSCQEVAVAMAGNREGWISVSEFQVLAMRLAAKMLFPGSGWLFRLHCVVAESRQPDADFFFKSKKLPSGGNGRESREGWISVSEFQVLAMRLAAKMLFPGSGWLFRLHCVVAESRQPDADFFFKSKKLPSSGNGRESREHNH